MIKFNKYCQPLGQTIQPSRMLQSIAPLLHEAAALFLPALLLESYAFGSYYKNWLHCIMPYVFIFSMPSI